MIRNQNELYKVMCDKIDEYAAKYGSHENWHQHVKTDQQLKFLRKLNQVYVNATVTATKYGHIGVGCISFAEQRMIRYQERLAKKFA